MNIENVNITLKDTLDIQLAYAITIHLSQGSDYQGVILTCSSEHDFMLRRNLIYTALTRAKSKVVIVGEMNSFVRGIKKNWVDFRYTNLFNILEKYIK